MKVDQGYNSESSSDEDEEFNHLQDAEPDQQTMSSEILVTTPDGLGSNKYTIYLGLLDSRASGSLADKKIIFSYPNSKTKTIETTWQTKASSFKTSEEVEVERLCLPQFTAKRKINTKFHLFDKNKEDTYSFILGRDFCQLVGLDVLNSKKTFEWGSIQVKMVPRDYWGDCDIQKFWATKKPSNLPKEE